MEKITSFTIDHLKLQPGLYVSRKDQVGAETVTTFDLRLTSPNEEPVMNTAEVHTIEHLAATYLRNEPVWKDRVLYFGPMGCRTGFYLLCWRGTMNPGTWWSWYAPASALSGILKERFPVPALRTAVIIWI